jgi:hypothetical protein
VLIEQLKTKTSIALSRPMIYPGPARHRRDLHGPRTMGPHVEAVANDWSKDGSVPTGCCASSRSSTGRWKRRSASPIAPRPLRRVRDVQKSELERLFRDCRAGRFHPGNPALTHEIVGKVSLGINLDEQPRWG